MSEILVLSLSNSAGSINKKFALLLQEKLQADFIELVDYQVDFYSSDLEKNAFPQKIKQLVKKLHEYKTLVFVTPEHNAFVPAFAKNIIDWMTRDDQYGTNNFLKGLNGVLCCVTPSVKGGGKTVLELLSKSFKFSGLNVKGTVLIAGHIQDFDFQPFINQVEKLI